MATITFHSDPMSVYFWTASHVAAEKGVDYDIVRVDPKSPAHRKLHPFAKMPVLQHRDIFLYETGAITHYIDRAFAGPPLQPADALGQAHVLRWISIVNGYLFPTMNGLVKERLVAPSRGEAPDEMFVANAVSPLAEQVALIEASVSRHPFLAGAELTIADSFLLPHLYFVTLTPEGQAAIANAPATRDWLARMRARASFDQTDIMRVAATLPQ